MKHLIIDKTMKEIWPDTRVGCLQYRVKVEKKNEELWKYLKKDIFKKTRDAIFDNGINEIPNVKESRAAYKAFGKDPSRYRVSSEALIRRIGQGKGLYEVMTYLRFQKNWYSGSDRKERLIRESEKMRSRSRRFRCSQTKTEPLEVQPVIQSVQ